MHTWLTPGNNFRVRVRSIDDTKVVDFSDALFTLAGAAASAALSEVGNYPNPFNPETTIRFQLPATAHVTVAVYDMTGREVAKLLDGTQGAGLHSVRFDARNLPSGFYLYRIQAGTAVHTGRMVLLK